MRHGRLLGALVFTLGAVSSAQAVPLVDFLSQGRLMLDTRYRYENVEQSGFAQDANANTVRERVSYETVPFWHLQALAEVQATQHLSNEFNDTVSGRTTYPQVPDPETFELNRLQLSYAGTAGTAVTLGRQLINLDDQRFIGASAFRQNEQTFDAARFDYSGIANLTVTYAYVDRVNRVFGDRSSVGHFNGEIHLFNVGYDVPGVGKLSTFGYLLDLDHNSSLSTATYGIQFTGKRLIEDVLSIHYIASYAHQTGYATNPLSLALDYWRVEGGFDYTGWSLTGGAETLGGNGVAGFSTPLATLHAFQGDADVFLTTPTQGIADRYAKLGYHMDFDALAVTRRFSVIAAYHDYATARGGSRLGHELDFDSILNINSSWRLDLAHAIYDGTPNFASRNKTWLSLTFNY
jgi:hypothetical protein